MWRKERDLNPRWSYPHNGFQDRRIQPLCHPSLIRQEKIYTLSKKQGQAFFLDFQKENLSKSANLFEPIQANFIFLGQHLFSC